MGKALIIAEKPSVANDISKALGKFQKHQDYFENDEFVISSAVGHLLTIVPPPGVEAAKGKWSFKHLPVIPPHFDLEPIERSADRLRVLKKLIKRDDVTELINACDAGREGELIFRNIVRHTNAKQPIKRLWLQSMTPASIREGFASLRSDESMQPLADAAISRSRGRLAGGHQRHAGDDGVQFQARRLFQDDGRAACRRRRWRLWSSARRRFARSSRAISGKSSARSTRRRAITPDAGSMKSLAGRTLPTTAGRTN